MSIAPLSTEEYLARHRAVVELSRRVESHVREWQDGAAEDDLRTLFVDAFDVLGADDEVIRDIILMSGGRIQMPLGRDRGAMIARIARHWARDLRERDQRGDAHVSAARVRAILAAAGLPAEAVRRITSGGGRAAATRVQMASGYIGQAEQALRAAFVEHGDIERVTYQSEHRVHAFGDVVRIDRHRRH